MNVLMNQETKHIESESDLLIMMKNNDVAAFDYLYDQYSSLLFGMALQSGASSNDAETILQTTFQYIWYSIQLYHYQCVPFKIWVIRIHLNSMKEFSESKSKIQITSDDFVISQETTTEMISVV
ncbi:hypothetical protein PGH12_17870 [Chryseobacterium wangxinyae]|uniref:RNA polymerase sigma factor n=1 Tax=Chryseobacterium sp. CY350 TaxID=2997336 RepID=UPI002272212E|nr:hypothetical protein [Chryseobacterium sp. CY350]MCY0977679.1 hypothetical protein [Chryseobacterium sp. CY350]WBZ95312.1 hypothetical protein PGH12_17870 [Chryseobacterium sp. CY350]